KLVCRWMTSRQQNSKKPLRSPWQILGQLMTIMTILKWQRPEPLRRFVVKVRNRLRELNRQRSCLNGCAMTILCSWDIANTKIGRASCRERVVIGGGARTVGAKR